MNEVRGVEWIHQAQRNFPRSRKKDDLGCATCGPT